MTLPTEIRFDGWVLRTDSGELTREGNVVRLQDQPLQVLLALLERPGAMVAREQLIARLWPKGVVDYDTGLNTVVRKLRAALADDAGEPRYIETIPRRGYRFIGGDRGSPLAAEVAPPAPEAEPAPPPQVVSASESVPAVDPGARAFDATLASLGLVAGASPCWSRWPSARGLCGSNRRAAPNRWPC